MTDALFQSIAESLERLMQAHAEGADATLFDLQGLIKALADWVTEGATSNLADRKMDENPYPLMLFLAVVGELPLFSSSYRHGKLSLEALTRDTDTLRLMAVVINTALARHRIGGQPTRELARSVVKSWMTLRNGHMRENGAWIPELDPLRLLARQLIVTAPTQDDVERIGFLFEPAFSMSDLANDLMDEGQRRGGHDNQDIRSH